MPMQPSPISETETPDRPRARVGSAMRGPPSGGPARAAGERIVGRVVREGSGAGGVRAPPTRGEGLLREGLPKEGRAPSPARTARFSGQFGAHDTLGSVLRSQRRPRAADQAVVLGAGR